ncbi:hypothetical protein FACS1894171_0080 [Clostridia bacterium]|nr:hypothetical protein FACS1894171_0080 [Clostridia bacterium]
MCGCLFVCRSLTTAQRMSRLLERSGITAPVLRLPGIIDGSGCGYSVKVPEKRLGDALIVVKRAGISPAKVCMLFEDGTYKELNE